MSPPDKLDEEHRAMGANLEQMSGAQLDHAYIQGQIIEHQKTAQLLEYEIGSGENAELKDFASDLLPMVLDHLQMARTIAQEFPQSADASSGAEKKRDGER